MLDRSNPGRNAGFIRQRCVVAHEQRIAVPRRNAGFIRQRCRSVPRGSRPENKQAIESPDSGPIKPNQTESSLKDGVSEPSSLRLSRPARRPVRHSFSDGGSSQATAEGLAKGGRPAVKTWAPPFPVKPSQGQSSLCVVSVGRAVAAAPP